MKKLDVNFESLKLCKDVKLLKQWVLKTPKNVLQNIVIKKLENKSFEEAMKIVWDYALQLDCGYSNGREVTKSCWYKGSAIAGMECHSK